MTSSRTCKANLNHQFHVHHDTEALSLHLALRFYDCARACLKKKEFFDVVLCGGSSPTRFFQLLGSLSSSDYPSIERSIWKYVRIFIGDERYLPFSHPESNFGNLNHLLLSQVPILKTHVFPIPTHFKNPKKAARSYERLLRSTLQLSESSPPSFDWALLGLGTDGHTLSLFPHSPIVESLYKNPIQTNMLVCQTKGPGPYSQRISLLPNAFSLVQEMCFLAFGKKKGALIQQVTCGPYQPLSLPAQLICKKNSVIHWWIDEEANQARCS